MHLSHLTMLLAALLAVFRMSGQDCPNIDLSEGNFNSWQGYTGSCCNINTPTPGIVPGRHTIVSGAGFIPFTCNQVPEVPPGYDFSARIGNSNTGAEAERITYTVDVSDESTLIIYRYAVILEDPGHSPSEQPRFLARVRNANGQVIQCTVYEVAASANLPGFVNCGSVVYQNWTTVGVDVSDYLGQQVTLEFATGDCSLGGHFGFAHVVAECRPLQLESRYCLGNTNLATITAPEGFTYLWSTGETTQSIQIANPQEGQIISCQITSVTGCQATLESVMTPTSTQAEFNPIVECTADAYFDNVSIVNNGEIASVQWISSDGFTSSDFHFSHSFATPGTYDVTLLVTSDVNCTDTVSQQILIRQSPVAFFEDGNICEGQTADLVSLSTISTGDALTNTWVYGDDTHDGDEVSLSYSEAGDQPVSLVTLAANGCMHTHDGFVHVFPNPEPSFTVADYCEEDQTTVVNTSVTHTLGPVYAWSNSPEPFTSSDLQPAISGIDSGEQTLTLTITETHNGVPCSASSPYTYTVHAMPDVDIASETELCSLEQFTFQNLTTVADGALLSYQWTLDGTQMSTGQHYAVALTEGVYQLSLNASSYFGCEGSVTRELRVYPYPAVTISAQPDGCPPFDPGATAVVTGHWGSDITYDWTVNGNPLSAAQNAPVVLDEAGLYSLHLEVTAGDALHQCPGSADFQIEAFELPVIGYEIGLSCIHSTYIDNATTLAGPATITGYTWDVSDGYATADEHFVHDFPSAGEFTVTLGASTSDGCHAEETFDITVHPNPVIAFQAVNPCTGESLQLQSGTTVADGSDLQLSWYVPSLGLAGEGLVFDPVVNDTGMTDVWHYAESSFGCSDSLLRSIEVFPDPVSVPVIPPVCQFDDIAAYNFSQVSLGNPEYRWTLGGALYSSGFLPEFDSSLPVNTEVSLLVREIHPEGVCEDEMEIPFIVHALPIQEITGDLQICEGEILQLTSASYTDDNSPFEHEWSLDGTVFASSPVTGLPMSESGTYTIELYEYTPHCESRTEAELEVYPSPVVTVLPDTSFCVPGEIMAEVIAESYWGEPTLYVTTLNGALAFTGPSSSLTFDEPGTYTLHSSVTAGDGLQQCTGTDSATVTVWPLPVPSFTWEPEKVDEDFPYLTLFNLSENYVSLDWNFAGDNLGGAEQVDLDLLNYPPGPYTVCLEATSQYGCVNTVCKILQLLDIPNVYVASAFTPDQDGLNEAFAPSVDNPDLLDFYEFIIFDRWGIELFRSTTPGEAWNGSLGGHYAQNDVYVFLLRYRENGVSEITEKVGTVTLIR
jgi:gliding motility-associated-like protein